MIELIALPNPSELWGRGRDVTDDRNQAGEEKGRGREGRGERRGREKRGEGRRREEKGGKERREGRVASS